MTSLVKSLFCLFVAVAVLVGSLNANPDSRGVSLAESEHLRGADCQWWINMGDGCTDDSHVCLASGSNYQPRTWWWQGDSYGERSDYLCNSAAPQCGNFHLITGCGGS
jgi:hypothetical protein